ncbi:MAG: ROK family transcriptional regulator [Proteobacteria bacterium]|nr:ROK family transcriptional regulator [Pseudomonadota bacterium]
MPAADRTLMRAINRFKVLHTIREHKLISRVDIARSTGLSQASVTGITAELIETGLLFEKQTGQSIGGRRPILLSLNPDGAYTLGVFLSVRQISVVIVNLQADILESHILPLAERIYTPEIVADLIVQAIHTCMWKTDLSKKQISGVGIAIPGLVDSQTGLIRFLPNYRWKEVNFRDMINEKIEIATHIENSANTLTLAEQWFGDGRGVDNFLTVNLEHGVGMGIVINGQLYRGHKGIAGEFGHITLEADGPLCRCGKRGCLEAFAGNNAILCEAETAAREGKWKPDDPHNISIEEVVRKARSGEECLEKIYAKAGRILGIGLANLIEILNPAKIIISGKGVNAGKLIFDPMYETVKGDVPGDIDHKALIVVKKWNPTDNARGAGALVLQEVYKSPANRILPTI